MALYYCWSGQRIVRFVLPNRLAVPDFANNHRIAIFYRFTETSTVD